MDSKQLKFPFAAARQFFKLYVIFCWKNT